jgi:hypothetical protein
MKYLLVALLALPLGACVTTGTVDSLKPVCEALGPPIKYNSKNTHSAYHAGPKLAPRLAQQNAVGENLSCGGY